IIDSRNNIRSKIKNKYLSYNPVRLLEVPELLDYCDPGSKSGGFNWMRPGVSTLNSSSLNVEIGFYQ
ncbi:MAG TPA: hypothetical protein DDZ90_02900, partial [Planctomycetaceae bacterium]|nr:hypothetical protein [Planctomycetaceae bacterium]